MAKKRYKEYVLKGVKKTQNRSLPWSSHIVATSLSAAKKKAKEVAKQNGISKYKVSLYDAKAHAVGKPDPLHLSSQNPGLAGDEERIDRISQREPYYGRHVEIWARTFEAWVHYELSKKHIVNTALTQFKYEAAVYPPAATMKKVAPIIRELIKHLTL